MEAQTTEQTRTSKRRLLLPILKEAIKSIDPIRGLTSAELAKYAKSQINSDPEKLKAGVNEVLKLGLRTGFFQKSDRCRYTLNKLANDEVVQICGTCGGKVKKRRSRSRSKGRCAPKRRKRGRSRSKGRCAPRRKKRGRSKSKAQCVTVTFCRKPRRKRSICRPKRRKSKRRCKPRSRRRKSGGKGQAAIMKCVEKCLKKKKKRRSKSCKPRKPARRRCSSRGWGKRSNETNEQVGSQQNMSPQENPPQPMQ